MCNIVEKKAKALSDHFRCFVDAAIFAAHVILVGFVLMSRSSPRLVEPEMIRKP